MTAQADIVDAWIQHPTPRMLAQPMFESLRRWVSGSRLASEARSEPERPDMDGRAGISRKHPDRAMGGEAIALDDTMAALDHAGVRTGLLSAWYGPQGALISNDEVAAWARQHPDRLAGIASVDLARPLEAVRELRRCVKELGFKGLRVLPWLWNLPPDDRRYYPLYAECCELGVPFCTQVGHTGPLCPSEPGRPIPYLDHVALEFPELVIVGGHIGYPWTLEMIALATKYPNVYIDTSAYKPSRYPIELVDYLRGHGRRKVLFGSNYPMLMPADCLQGVAGLGLDAEARALFLAGTARRVFALVT